MSSSVARTAPDRCAVLIPSWDGYADLWPPFFELFWRYWPDCPFPVFLGAETKSFIHPRVTMVHVQPGKKWGACVRSQVAALKSDYVMLVLEDFFWRSATPTEQILQCLDGLHLMGGHMMRLTNRPPPDVRLPGQTVFGEVAVGAPYRVSTQATIWRRESLLGLLRDDESIWDFELKGSRRSDAIASGYYSTWRQLVPYGTHVVERGKWFRHEAAWASRHGVQCDFRARPIMTRSETLRWRLSWMNGRAQQLIPWPQRERLKSALRRLLGREESFAGTS